MSIFKNSVRNVYLLMSRAKILVVIRILKENQKLRRLQQ